jgi:hypothetical protein
VKRKLFLFAATLLLTNILLPVAMRADLGDPPPLCGDTPSSCTPPPLMQHFVR